MKSRIALGSPKLAAPAAGFSYVGFAKAYPFANNVLIATCKTSAADLVAPAGAMVGVAI